MCRREDCPIERTRKALREMAAARIAKGEARTYSANDYVQQCSLCNKPMKWTRDADGSESPILPNYADESTKHL